MPNAFGEIEENYPKRNIVIKIIGMFILTF